MFSGSIPALITPFNNGNVDFDSFNKFYEEVDAIVIMTEWEEFKFIDWKEVSEMIDGYSEQVANFQLSVDEMMSKVERYFRKEKYAITKGMITEIINEEKLNG